MPVRILVVDDEPDLKLLVRQRFRRKIRTNEWEFSFAEDGIEALETLTADPDFDLVMTDINMPRMDGLTLLNRLNEQGLLLKTVVVSAYGDMENIRVAMNRGAFDFVTKPIDFDDLEVTINKTWETVRTLKEARDTQGKLRSIQHELDIARSIQARFLPATFPSTDSFLLHASMKPARNVGGDFYDFFFLDNKHLGIAIGDVTGKGISAALFMAVTRTLLKATALHMHSPAECLRTVNRLLHPESLASMFVTVFYGVLDLETGTFIYCNAGHNPPFVLRNDHKVHPLERTGGLALCLMKDFAYTERKTVIDSGEGLLLYTDGLTEAMDRERNEFTEERLVPLLESLNGEPPRDLVEKVMTAIKTFSNGVPQTDDLTMLALRFQGPPPS